MASHRNIARGLVAVLLGTTLLVTAACSRPTVVSPEGGTTPDTDRAGDAGGADGSATQASPYDVTSEPLPTEDGVYPPPPSATPPTPAAYLGPGEGGAEATAVPEGETTAAPEGAGGDAPAGEASATP